MTEQWFYAKDNERSGPVTLDEVRRLYQGGQINPQTLVWNELMTDWAPAASVAELQPAEPTAGDEAPPNTTPTPVHVGTLSYSVPREHTFVFSARALDMLRQTRPWARLISILIWIGAVFLICIGMFGAFMLARGQRSPLDAAAMLLYIPLSLLYVMPAIYLGRYATRISQLQYLRRPDLLESALEAQKSFWKFCGIACLVVLLLYGFIALVALIVAISR